MLPCVPMTRRPSSFIESEDGAASMKFLVVTGGTVSGLGKGTALSAIGVVLKSHGLRVTAIKIDPYLNIDASTINPFEHGEAYVLEDGGEVDMDLGNYERFLDLTLTASHHITTGKIYEQVLKRERTGHYFGKTVQTIPDITDAIQDWIADVCRKPVDKSGLQPQLCLVELGGTVGDIEVAVFLEALQQLYFKVGHHNFVVAHVGMVPVMGATGEQKTKPCQHSVRVLREAGLRPDILLCRSEQPLEEATRKKLSLFCQVPPETVVSLHDISNIYRVPLLLAEQLVGQSICRRLCFSEDLISTTARTLQPGVYDNEDQFQRLGGWRELADRVDACADEVVVAIVGKYTGLHDSYVSIIKALKHAAVEAGLHLTIEWVDAGDLEPNVQRLDHKRHEAAWWKLKKSHGVLVPGSGGQSDRRIEGKILAVHYSRCGQLPFLGVCVGMQTAVIEFARSELGWENANSTEFDDSTGHPVVVFMPEASSKLLGGTARVGLRTTFLKEPGSLTSKLYGGISSVEERHRHRHEVNVSCVPAFESKGLRFTGQDERGQRMQIMELQGHPFFLASQFHPEFHSRPSRPAPLVLGFVLACARLLDKRLEDDGGMLRVGSGFGRRI